MSAPEKRPVRDELTLIRRAMKQALYGCLLTLAASLAIGVGNVWYTNSVDQRRAADDRARAREGQDATCVLVVAQLGAFEENPPTAPGGKALQEAWTTLAARFQCKGR